MSLSATQWAREQRGLTSSERVVLLQLADQVPSEQQPTQAWLIQEYPDLAEDLRCRVAWPGLEHLADSVELSERQVRRLLRSLEGKALIRTFAKGRAGRRSQKPVYELFGPAFVSDGLDPPGRTATSGDSDTDVRPPRVAMSAESVSREPTIEESDQRAARATSPRDDREQVRRLIAESLRVRNGHESVERTGGHHA